MPLGVRMPGRATVTRWLHHRAKGCWDGVPDIPTIRRWCNRSAAAFRELIATEGSCCSVVGTVWLATVVLTLVFAAVAPSDWSHHRAFSYVVLAVMVPTFPMILLCVSACAWSCFHGPWDQHRLDVRDGSGSSYFPPPAAVTAMQPPALVMSHQPVAAALVATPSTISSAPHQQSERRGPDPAAVAQHDGVVVIAADATAEGIAQPGPTGLADAAVIAMEEGCSAG